MKKPKDDAVERMYNMIVSHLETLSPAERKRRIAAGLAVVNRLNKKPAEKQRAKKGRGR